MIMNVTGEEKNFQLLVNFFNKLEGFEFSVGYYFFCLYFVGNKFELLLRYVIPIMKFWFNTKRV